MVYSIWGDVYYYLYPIGRMLLYIAGIPLLASVFIAFIWSEKYSPEGEGTPLEDIEGSAFDLAVRKIIDGLPSAFKEIADGLDIEISDEDGAALGLYTGVPLVRANRYTSDLWPRLWRSPKRGKIVLYEKAIERVALQKDISLEEIIKHVFIHEVAHAIGYNDDEIYEPAGRI